MKNLLLLSALLLFSITQAQDYELMKTLRSNVSQEKALQLVGTLVGQTPRKYHLYKTKLFEEDNMLLAVCS